MLLLYSILVSLCTIIKDLDIIKGWDINTYHLREIKNTVLDGIINTRLDKALFRTAKDKLLCNEFV